MKDDAQDPKPSDGAASEEPHIYAVKKKSSKTGLSRREFLEISTVSAVAASLAGCDLISQVEQAVDDAQARPTITGRPPSEAEPSRTPRPTDTRQPTATHTPTRTPTPTDSPTPTAITFPATARDNDTNVRSGPATEYPRVTQVNSGEIVTLIGRVADNSWFQILTAQNIIGWIRADLISYPNQPVSELPIVQAPPTPTPLPGREGTTWAGDTGIDYEYTDIYGNTYTFTLPCGSPIPPGAVCICNCVTVPAACTCDAYEACTCDEVCTCDSVCSCDYESHYWYPN